jgi:hypothetical protein
MKIRSKLRITEFIVSLIFYPSHGASFIRPVAGKVIRGDMLTSGRNLRRLELALAVTVFPGLPSSGDWPSAKPACSPATSIRSD